MPEAKLKEIADHATMIVSGYAFTLTADRMIQVLNLDDPTEACVLQEDGTMVETTMNDITLLKIQAYYLKNKEFMEDQNA